MKYFILLFLISFPLAATTFGKYRSTPDGIASQTFVIEGKEKKLEKTSNYFDLTDTDYSIGIYRTMKEKEFTALMASAEDFSKKIAVVDEFLKTKGSSFNDVSGGAGHETVILVNEYRIKKESKYYAELDVLFKKLRTLDWDQQKGYAVTKDLSKLLEIDYGKTIRTSRYARDLYCQSTQLPTMCTFYGGGQIYVK